MIKFKWITIRNFLMVGNKPVKFNLDTQELTLIHGTNGSGKSTIIDAICYALFGTPHRPKLLMGDLVNDKNKKRMEVVLEFVSGDDTWKIVRGIKPDKLIIKKNDEELESLSSKKLNQQMIIDEVIGFDKDLFLQINVVGKANYQPYMDLSASKRRDFIDRVFNWHVFGLMKDETKKVHSQCVKSRDELKQKIQILVLKIQHGNELLKQSQQNHQQKISEAEKELESTLEKVSELETTHKELNGKVQQCVSSREIARDIDRCNRSISDLRGKGIVDTCSSCGQTLPDDIIEKRKAQLEENQLRIVELHEKVKHLEEELIKSKKIEDEQSELKSSIMATFKMIKSFDIKVKSYQKKISSLKKKMVKIDVDVDDLKSQLVETRGELDKQNSILDYVGYMKDQFLHDKGFKSFLMLRYRSELEKIINQTLAEYTLPIKVKMMDDLKMKLYKPDGKMLNYPRLSEGQKQRVNLSIWEGFTHMVKLKRNVDTNLIFFDEILDGSLDTDGQDVFMDRLSAKIRIQGKSGFIISHSIESFNRRISVTVQKGFSQYEVHE